MFTLTTLNFFPIKLQVLYRKLGFFQKGKNLVFDLDGFDRDSWWKRGEAR